MMRFKFKLGPLLYSKGYAGVSLGCFYHPMPFKLNLTHALSFLIPVAAIKV